jgi:hypothetical protein
MIGKEKGRSAGEEGKSDEVGYKLVRNIALQIPLFPINIFWGMFL